MKTCSHETFHTLKMKAHFEKPYILKMKAHSEIRFENENMLHCASFCRSFVAHMGRILDMKALLTNNTKVFISSSNDKSIKVCENETEGGAPE